MSQNFCSFWQFLVVGSTCRGSGEKCAYTGKRWEGNFNTFVSLTLF